MHAKATSPIPIAAGDLIFSEYDLDRPVTAARLDRRGNIVLDLSYAEGQVGGGTLGYIVSRGRNVQLDLVYTITQNAPIAVRNGRSVTIERFVQGRLSDPEVDAFSYRSLRLGDEVPAVLARPRRPSLRGRGKRPLVVWLHGGGEGASLPDDYYDNETTLRANRGALGFATPQAQRIFSGAYVVAPQSTSYWIEDGPRFAPLIREIIRDVVRRYPIDRDRIYVAGCSNGGYMTMKMTSVYPDLFAAAVPICGVVESLQPGGPRLITDAELSRIDTPTWLVASRDDDDGAAGAQHRPRARPHPRLLDDAVRPRHLERLPVPRPLVVDLRRPQRPEHQRNPHLAVDGPATKLTPWNRRLHVQPGPGQEAPHGPSPVRGNLVSNVTAIVGDELSFVTIWNVGDRPKQSELNVDVREVAANGAILHANSDMSNPVYNRDGRTDLIIDAVGRFVCETCAVAEQSGGADVQLGTFASARAPSARLA